MDNIQNNDSAVKITSRMEISVYPIGTGNKDISSHIFPLLEIVEKSGLTHQVTVTGTIVEGETGKLFDLAENLHRAAFSGGAKRAITLIKIDGTV